MEYTNHTLQIGKATERATKSKEKENNMSTWYSVDLGDGIAAQTPRFKILEIFPQAFAAAGTPLDMAVFTRNDTKSNTVTVYFSPSAFALAKIFNATPCEKPSSVDLSLLAGDARAWNIFFLDATPT